MVKIVQNGDPVLRGKAALVAPADIGSPAFKRIIAQMQKALAAEKDGVAIAAPQIGVPLSIFLVSGKVLIGTKDGPAQDRVFVNPRITRLSKEREWLEEGCLSVRWKYGEVHRAKKATVRALDENGKAFSLNASGLLAQIFQHETDHLNGVLFTDAARNVRDIPPEPVL